MAESVVDRLEVVEIHEEDTHRLLVASPDLHQLCGPVQEQRPVRQAGERVMQRLISKLRLKFLAIGDVRHHDADADQLSEDLHRIEIRPPVVGPMGVARDSAGDLTSDDWFISLLYGLGGPIELGPEPGNNLFQQPANLVFHRPSIDRGKHRVHGRDPRVPIDEPQAHRRCGRDAVEDGEHVGQVGRRVHRSRQSGGPRLVGSHRWSAISGDLSRSAVGSLRWPSRTTAAISPARGAGSGCALRNAGRWRTGGYARCSD